MKIRKLENAKNANKQIGKVPNLATHLPNSQGLLPFVATFWAFSLDATHIYLRLSQRSGDNRFTSHLVSGNLKVQQLHGQIAVTVLI